MIRNADIPEVRAEPLDGLSRRYRVTGPQPVHGTLPGATFTAALDPGQEQFLIGTGHIKIVRPAPDTRRRARADKEY